MDYISREEAIKELLSVTAITDDLFGMGQMAGTDTAIHRINNLPAADVRPVVRGKWEVSMDGNGWTVWAKLTCPACKTEFKELPAVNFCPKCGAMMGGQDNA